MSHPDPKDRSQGVRFHHVLEQSHATALIAALQQPAFVAMDDGYIIGMNSSAGKLFGGGSGVYGHAVHELFPFVGEGKNKPRSDRIWHGALPMPDGRVLDADVSQNTVREENLPSYSVYVVHDVSRHVSVSRSRQWLLYSVAHELRGPLTVLDMALDVLSQYVASAPVGRIAHVMNAARRRLAYTRHLMDALLNVGSIRSGHMQVHPQRTAVASLVAEALDQTGDLIAERGQQIVVGGGMSDLVVLCDPRLIVPALVNLLVNAAKYSDHGGVIEVRAELVGQSVRVGVVDQGPGIPEWERAALFERFYRPQNAGDVPGTGLGLAVAKEIVEAHAGAIDIENIDGRGAHVWITLPAIGE
jgi:signal transduction histidine kinase